MLLTGYVGGLKTLVGAGSLILNSASLLALTSQWIRREPTGVRGLDGNDGPVTACRILPRWRTLGVVSRLMPPAAGRRWLAEAASSLVEMDPGERAAAVRSYLRSAPRVMAMTWGREMARRTRRRAG
jgi:hypothetical protein